MGSAPAPFRVPDCSAEEKQLLLTLARDAIRHAIQCRPPPDVPACSLTPTLVEPAATFITLTLAGELRGCVGNLVARDPLHRSVMDNAAGAALRDQRFSPVTLEESGHLKVHISILSALVPLRFNGPAELLDQLTAGIDGVVLRHAGRTSTYLPQVWKAFPDKETFLASLCRKAGLDGPAWKEAGAELLIYRVSDFGDGLET
ncbi:MAG: AmmeMemoRadiSam system protein A [Verrucomicrobia bacterium]|nr:AmmeMemoRadiSam system protein A [Verrucomicrobiota bacterium]